MRASFVLERAGKAGDETHQLGLSLGAGLFEQAADMCPYRAWSDSKLRRHFHERVASSAVP